MNKLKVYAICVIAVLSSVFFGVTQCNRAEQFKDERDEAKSNVETLVQGQKDYKIKDSLNASEIKALTLSEKEYKKLYAESQNDLKNLKDHPKKVTEYVTKFNTTTETKWKVDTVLINSDSCQFYTDGFTTINLCKDSVYVMNTDTIQQVISKHYKHKFLWWKWKMDGVTQDIYSKNPHSNIVFDNFVKVE